MRCADHTATQLLRACLDTGDAEAWAEFIARYQRLVAGVIARIVQRHGPANPALVDDLVQETYMRLCRNQCRALRELTLDRDEAIFGFLKVVASSVALDHFRTQQAGKRATNAVPLDEANAHMAVDPAASPVRDAERAELWVRLRQIAGSERDAAVFRLYYQQGFTAREIAALPCVGLSAKGVESCLHRLTSALRGAMTRPAPEGQSAPLALGEVR